MRRFRFVLLLDIRRYFLSFDPVIMQRLLDARLREPPLRRLLGAILEGGRGLYDPPEVRAFLGFGADRPTGRGLPIGNLTSQWWGNHYLSGLDHFLRRELRVGQALRYLDDIAVFGDDAGELVTVRDRVTDWLAQQRHLRLKQPGAQPRPTARECTYRGHRVSRSGVKPPRRALRKFAQRMGALVRSGEGEEIERSIASYAGLFGVSTRPTDLSLE